MRIVLVLCISLMYRLVYTQQVIIKDAVTQLPVPMATIKIGKQFISADTNGRAQVKIINPTKITITATGYVTTEKLLQPALTDTLHVFLAPVHSNLEELVVSGTLKAVLKSASPVPVEVYTTTYLKQNPSFCVFDALQNVNGVRPQLNCNICNTGDIHINGLEGPYTMVLIDGMPIVSSLATVYGLNAIPTALIDKIEIVKGPASSLYGSEAIGGLINIITKPVTTAPLLYGQLLSTGYNEHNADVSFKTNLNKKLSLLTGINYFNFNTVVDKNKDGFTDVTLQNRFSLFQKFNFKRKNNKELSIALRYFYEDRWGGETRWNKTFRGTDSIYGESIFTNRWEVVSKYQLPLKENIVWVFSANGHYQNSVYGTTYYNAKQYIGFNQLTWDKQIKNNTLLLGAALRYTYYDDNTTATKDETNNINKPDRILLPGIFLQNEIAIHKNHSVLAGVRADYHPLHQSIITPRLAYKWNINANNLLRVNMGTGFRVVNIFTEDHAALTGAREVEIASDLRPEKSINLNLHYSTKVYSKNVMANIDAGLWYTHFSNKILPDYETHPNKIIYNNLEGYAVSKGFTLNTDVTIKNNVKFTTGITLMNVNVTENDITQQQILTEKFTGTWGLSYTLKKLHLLIDYTGNVYGPMRLPLLGSLDPREPYSPTWSIQNIQFTYKKLKQTEVFGGIKNLLNWTPFKTNNPFLIARTTDPFDKQVQYNALGQVIPTADNPYALTFDPNYVYAPLQGIRFFAGIRVTVK